MIKISSQLCGEFFYILIRYFQLRYPREGGRLRAAIFHMAAYCKIISYIIAYGLLNKYLFLILSQAYIMINYFANSASFGCAAQAPPYRGGTFAFIIIFILIF